MQFKRIRWHSMRWLVWFLSVGACQIAAVDEGNQSADGKSDRPGTGDPLLSGGQSGWTDSPSQMGGFSGDSSELPALTGGSPGEFPPDGTSVGTGGSPILGTPPIGRVPAFVAIGHGGRRVISCDDGLTWKETCETAGMGNGPCRMNNSDGDHEEWSAQSVAFGDGVFLALFGWFGGSSAHVLRSSDGRTWQHVFGASDTAQGTWGTGIAFGDHAFVVNAQRSGTHRTVDAGNTWSTTTFRNSDAEHRRTLIYIPYQGGRFLSYGDNKRLTYSDDGGITWREKTTNCAYIKGMAWGGEGVLVANDYNGRCSSVDGGITWTQINEWNGDSEVVWTGSDFLILVGTAKDNKSFRSKDGKTWTTALIKGGGFGPTNIGLISLNSYTGTLVGLSRQGDDYYRSIDGGRSWQTRAGLSGTRFTKVAFGEVVPGVECPLP